MRHKLEFTGTLIKLGIAAVVSTLLFVIVINAIKSPVEGDTHIYTADFTDVSGLHVNGDVRAKGVQIGKVLSVDLRREGADTIAKVGFSLTEPNQLTDNTVLAVKYQNLTGARFLDLEAPAQPGGTTDHLTTAQTRPSFDITELFNGLQPVLTTMSTDEINTFTQNAITLLQGDGGGLAPMLDSVQKLSDVARDREQVISTLVANLSRISDTLGGKSPQVVDFLQAMSVPIGRAMTVLDDFTKTAQFGPNFTRPLQKIIVSLGLSEDLDIDQLLAQSFSSMTDAAEALRLLPVAFAGLQLPQLTQQPGEMGCSNGIAQLPTEVKVLLNGSEVVLCKAK